MILKDAETKSVEVVQSVVWWYYMDLSKQERRRVIENPKDQSEARWVDRFENPTLGWNASLL